MFFVFFGFFFLNVFFDKDFLGEFWGLVSFWIVFGFGKFFVFIFVVFLNFGFSDFKFFYDLFSDKFELVFVLVLLLCFFWLVFINFGFMGVFRDCLCSMVFFLLKFFGGGLFWSKWMLFKSEEFVFCCSSFWVVVGFCGLECLVIFCGCCMFVIMFWIFMWFFFLWRIKFFFVWCSNLLSLLIWFVMFFILIFIEFRIWLKKDKIIV